MLISTETGILLQIEHLMTEQKALKELDKRSQSTATDSGKGKSF